MRPMSRAVEAVGSNLPLLGTDSLLSALGSPRRLRLTAATWEAAAVIAGLRVAVNDRFRASDRDRGEPKNLLADITGSIGELVALRRLNEETSGQVEHHPIDFGSSVDAADLVVAASDGSVLLETKTHLDAPGKHWLMVNERARDRSERRGAVGYVPVLSALGGDLAWVGKLVTIAELHGWGPPDKPLRDSAVGLTLTEVAPTYFASTWPVLREELRPGSAVGEDRLKEIFAEARGSLEAWEARLPPLGSLTATQVVEAIQAHL